MDAYQAKIVASKEQMIPKKDVTAWKKWWPTEKWWRHPEKIEANPEEIKSVAKHAELPKRLQWNLSEHWRSSMGT
jgi:hypothetical protein